jgi:UDP-N-acetylmuramoyl-L-alanyl-D-glutamate--2,6-diaminopimelate ligase
MNIPLTCDESFTSRDFPLKTLLEGLDFDLVCGSRDGAVADIAYDSRLAGPGMLFVCLPGVSGSDGHDYAGAAYEKGVRAFLCQYMPAQLADKTDVTILKTENTRSALAQVSAKFFGHPDRRLKLAAITGTKGKTTISFMLKSIFEHAGKKVGLIGSNGVFYGDIWYKLPNTTPESYTLQKILRDMADAGVEYCFLEATSQGFFLHRTDGLHFALGLYTNISPDHISKTEHPDFEHYFACKQRIFTQTKLCFVGREEPLFDAIVKDAPCEIRTFGFGGTETAADYRAEDVRYETEEGRMLVRFLCRTPRREFQVAIRIPGRFNAANAMAAICVSDFFDIPNEDIREGLAGAVVHGRMEIVDVPAPYTVLIDFAHNKLSMESLMETAKQYRPKRILCVFGLEGNRAHIRRFDSGEILGRDADFTILANASPRTDDPDKILRDIASAIEKRGGDYTIIPDRKDAIFEILGMAREGDLVLLVGKGNVLYEEVGGVNIPFDERAVIKEYFAK